MKLWLTYFIFAASFLYPFSLKEKFEQGEEGSFIVTEQNQLISLVHLHTKKGSKLLFEEISIPLHQGKSLEWKTWVKKGAPGHTSWILYEVDLEKNQVTECYSCSRKSWIPVEEMASFLIPLISLKLDYLSENIRTQTGPTQRPGTIQSKPWSPPQVIDGKKIQDPNYDVFTAKWPADHTELSGKSIVLYFDKNQLEFPFPYWLQVRDGGLKFKMRALDSGSGLTSIHSEIPRRLPRFIGSPRKNSEHIILTLNLPEYYKTLSLYAVDFSGNSKSSVLVPFEKKTNGNLTSLNLPIKKVEALLVPGHEYVWIIASDDPKMVMESPYRYIPRCNGL